MQRLAESTAALVVLSSTGSAALTAREQPIDSWTPEFLNSEQNDTLVALGNRIIPGSAGAFCNKLIDSVLAIESQKNKSEFLTALSAFDTEAQRLYQTSFRQLAPDQQDHILAAVSTDTASLYPQFGLIKEWLADGYWSSQQGLRELGWTGRLAWDSFPDCDNPHPHN